MITLKELYSAMDEGMQDLKSVKQKVSQMSKTEGIFRDQMGALVQILNRDSENKNLSKTVKKLYREHITMFMRELIAISKKVK